MPTAHAAGNGIKTTRTVFGIVEAIHDLDGASIAELSRHLDLAKSTIHDHLVTLQDEGYVLKDDDGEYILSLKFLYHGSFAKNKIGIVSFSKSVIEKLAEKTGEAVWIIVEENDKAVYLSNANGENAIRTHAEVGRRSGLHHLAAGKQILAYKEKAEVDRIIEEQGLAEITPNTITNPSELKAELDDVREQQVSYNDRETVNGVRAIAAPVLDSDEFVCAVCVSGPANRMTFDRCENEIKPLLLGVTNELELRLQYPES
jgi:DNA-binding IclR family transcriptional regulator